MDTSALGAVTLALGKAGLSAGTTTTLTLGNTLDFAIKSRAYQKAAASNAASPTTDRNTGVAFTALAASQACAFAVCLDSGGSYRVYQGPIVDLDANGNYAVAPEFPGVKDTDCIIAGVVAKNGSTGSAWTFGSSNWTATGMTATFVDLIGTPDRPFTS